MRRARDEEVPRGQHDRNKTTWKDTVFVILELSLRRNRVQPVDTVMKSPSLHLKTLNRHVQRTLT